MLPQADAHTMAFQIGSTREAQIRKTDTGPGFYPQRSIMPKI
jgi:hypothetical protein